MSRLIPYPLLAIALLVMWLLLTQSFSPGQVLLGAIVAILGTRTTRALQPQSSTVVRLRALLRLARFVVADIIRSNFAVAGIILFPRRGRVAGLVRMPLELTNPHALALLALIVTATPGTLWVDFDRRSGVLLIHVLDLTDEDELIRLIKRRYEALLLEAFGG
jgi:multicomponent K+:H+ antiporter subunit E